MYCLFCVFFFKQKTAYEMRISDWSSDVCSSDLQGTAPMSTEVKVPTLGESVTEATIGEWLKKPGEAVALDEPIASLETDKVAVEEIGRASCRERVCQYV